jgi:hypothetical protein
MKINCKCATGLQAIGPPRRGRDRNAARQRVRNTGAGFDGQTR